MYIFIFLASRIVLYSLVSCHFYLLIDKFEVKPCGNWNLQSCTLTTCSLFFLSFIFFRHWSLVNLQIPERFLLIFPCLLQILVSCFHSGAGFFFKFDFLWKGENLLDLSGAVDQRTESVWENGSVNWSKAV